MIETIMWREISMIWVTELWVDRKSPIEKISLMMLNGENDPDNIKFTPTFFGYKDNGKLVGVNSGHMCADGSYRSRGLWVNEKYRKQGIGQELLKVTISQAKTENATGIWSYPRQSSWSTYNAVGFNLVGDWHPSETSDANAYCSMIFVVN
jgi:GNAT superfamily N-acetyltransferase